MIIIYVVIIVVINVVIIVFNPGDLYYLGYKKIIIIIAMTMFMVLSS